MSQFSFLSFGRYVVVAIAIVLLAPYAGCHILTNPPIPPASLEGSGVEEQERNSKSSSRVSATEPTEESKTEVPSKASESNLSDIESLLREP